MNKKLLPPLYVHAPALLVYSDMPRAIAMTGIRIWGLGYQHHYERTGWIPLEVLLSICRVERSQLYEHLGHLVATGMLRYTNINGEFTFTFDQRWMLSPENRTGSTLSVVVDSNLSTNTSKQQQQQEQEASLIPETKAGPQNPAQPDWAGRRRTLSAMGVLEPTCSELAELEWVTEEYLARWDNWMAVHEDVGVGLLVKQIRGGIAAPELTREQRARGSVRQWMAEVIQR